MNFWNPFIRIAGKVASRGRKPTGPRVIPEPLNNRLGLNRDYFNRVQTRAAELRGAKRKDNLDLKTWALRKKDIAERKILPLRSSLDRSDQSFSGEYYDVYSRKIGPVRIKKTETVYPITAVDQYPRKPVTQLRDGGITRTYPGGHFEQWSVKIGKDGLKGHAFSKRREVGRAIKKHKVATAVGAKTAAVSAAAAAASQRKKPTTRIGTAYRPRRIPKNPKKGRR